MKGVQFQKQTFTKKIALQRQIFKRVDMIHFREIITIILYLFNGIRDLKIFKLAAREFNLKIIVL